MNRRALKLVITALFVALLGVVAAPGVSIADPIADKQAEAQQLAAQINDNQVKLGALNEQMNSTQNELDKANADIATADALVVAAKSKTKEPKGEKLSAIDAAAQVLAGAKEPLNAKEMIEVMAAKGLWTSPGGKTPWATLYSALIREIALKGKEARFVKTERGKFAAK